MDDSTKNDESWYGVSLIEDQLVDDRVRLMDDVLRLVNDEVCIVSKNFCKFA